MSEHESEPVEITWDELKDVQPAPSVQLNRRITTSGASLETGNASHGEGNILDRIVPTAIWQGMLAGLVGGVLGMVAGEFLRDPVAPTFEEVLRFSSTWSALVALVFTFCII